MTSTTWPEGVIARYLTAAGAALQNPDLCTEVVEGEGDYDTARCAVCPASVHYTMGTARFIAKKRGQDPDFLSQAEPSRLAWQWAQAHAETCRALPAPGGAR